MRVLDLGALVAWLVWFYRHADDEPDDWKRWDDPGGEPPPAPEGPPGGGVRAPLPDADPWPVRLRDHSSQRPPATPSRRPIPAPARRTPTRTGGPTQGG